MRLFIGILVALLAVALIAAGPVAGLFLERNRLRRNEILGMRAAIVHVDSSNHWAAGEPTREIPLVQIEEGYLVEDLTEAHAQFLADPLSPWLLPPVEEVDYLPAADETFRHMVAMNWLTGDGFDIDIEWEAWNLYEREEANA